MKYIVILFFSLYSYNFSKLGTVFVFLGAAFLLLIEGKNLVEWKRICGVVPLLIASLTPLINSNTDIHLASYLGLCFGMYIYLLVPIKFEKQDLIMPFLLLLILNFIFSVVQQVGWVKDSFYLDLMAPFTGESQRFRSWSIFGVYFARVTGLYAEPSGLVTVVAFATSCLISFRTRVLPVLVLAILTLALAHSLFGYLCLTFLFLQIGIQGYDQVGWKAGRLIGLLIFCVLVFGIFALEVTLRGGAEDPSLNVKIVQVLDFIRFGTITEIFTGRGFLKSIVYSNTFGHLLQTLGLFGVGGLIYALRYSGIHRRYVWPMIILMGGALRISQPSFWFFVGILICASRMEEKMELGLRKNS